ncbi:MAG: RNA methyltransferase [Hydrotalea sp.]|nr:RNA methyltransferase [Hydrotalea sp.]
MTNPTIILVRPQLPENIGMASRAMLNFGFTDMMVVAPRDEFPSVEAISASSGASDVIFPKAQVFDSLKPALKNFHYIVATSARPRDQAIGVLSPGESLRAMQQATARGDRVAVMFGPERTGLTNDDIIHANHILEFPTNPEFPSLNLAGSVLLFCYAWAQLHDGRLQESRPAFTDTASVESRDYFINRLLAALEENGFFKSAPMKPSLSRNIVQMISRANFSEQEIRTWQGIITNLLEKK